MGAARHDADTTIPFVHAILDARPLGDEIARHYDFGAPFHCELLVRGMNDVYLVRAGAARYAARCWRSLGVTDDSVAYELGLLVHLDHAGVPVVAPLPTRDGTLHFWVRGPDGRRAVALFHWADGDALHEHPEPIAPARCFGELIAQMHLAARDYAPAAPRQTDYAGHLRRGLDHLAWLCDDRPDDIAFYKQAVPAVADALDRLDHVEMPRGPTHGDIHAHNAFIDAAGAVTIMDFESCGEDFWAQDLVSLVWAGRKNGFSDAAIAAFLDGYDTVRLRTAEERDHEALFFAAKELRYLCGFATRVNAIGHNTFRFPGLDWFARSVRANVAATGVI